MLSSFRFPRLGVVAASVALLAATACAGNSGSAPVPNTLFCGNDTQYALARPQSGQAVPIGTSTVEIVASGNNNQIAQSYQSFDLLFVPANNGNPTVATGQLSPARDPNGYQPFTSDYYYNGTIASPGLAPGTLYNVYVNAFTSSCTPVGPIGQLGT